MPFKFQWLCELLDELNSNRHKCARSAARAFNHEHQIVHRWYERFSHRIERTGPGAIAFLSCLFPERRPDRVYGLQHTRLSQIFGRALGLGASRAAELNQWTTRNGADFPDCIERVMQQCENQPPARGKEVTLEELNDILDLIAARSLSSSAAIRARTSKENVIDLLTPVICRLHSREAKWLVRMMLKRYTPVQIPEYEALHGFHFILPDLLAIQNSFEAAVSVLAKEAIRYLPARPERNYETALHTLVSEHMQPQVGIMVRRQPYHKARSIKNCSKLAATKQMSVERKYDGEYCQIHIDMSRKAFLQIFSKSGRNSTSDRTRLHSAIEGALRIGRNGCRIRRNCIVEGELLVWSSTSKSMLPFHKIRKHVKHGGRYIGTAHDSPVHRDEHLMIVFYDILLLDDQPLLNKAHQTRRQYLKAVLHTTEGRAILGERTIIDFRSSQASRKLRETFAKAVTQRWEGLVLKGSQDPYFIWGRQCHGIKLKKDYIAGLGDSADLCIVGGRRDAHVEVEIGLGPLRWTTFYVGAVRNLEDVRRFDTKPRIKIIDILTHHSMPDAEMLDLNCLGQLIETPFAQSIAEFDVEMGHFGIKQPTDLFTRPFIVEIMGAGFEKTSNSPYYTLRFPRKTDGKVRFYTDRTLRDTVSFSELQAMAEHSLSVPKDADSQEDAFWIERLLAADGKRQEDQRSSQPTSSVITPTSAPTVSLSPVSPKCDSSQIVFIRPDTEEPETQWTEYSTQADVGTRVDRRADQMAAQTSSATKRTSRVASILCERVFSTPSNESNDKAQKRCLDDTLLANIQGQIHSNRPTDIVPTDSSQEQLRLTSHRANATKLSLHKLHLNASSETTTFFTPVKATKRSRTNENQGQDSLPTPESEGEQFAIPSNTDYFSIPALESRVSSHQLGVAPSEDARMKDSIATVRLSTMAEISPPVLLTHPIATQIPKAILSVIEASYTFSIKNFLQHIRIDLASRKEMACHIILIHREDINSVVDTLSLLAIEVEHYVTSVQGQTTQCTTESTTAVGVTTDCHQQRQQVLTDLNDRILVFDHHVLDEISIRGPKNKDIHDKLVFNVETLSALDFNNGKGKDAALFIGSIQFMWRGAQSLPTGKNVAIDLAYKFDWVKKRS